MFSFLNRRSTIYYSTSEDYSVNTYRITYRKINGSTGTVTIQAVSESDAMSTFYSKFDGRIITVEVI